MVSPVTLTTDPITKSLLITWAAEAFKVRPESVEEELQKLEVDNNYPGKSLRLPIDQFNALRGALFVKTALKENLTIDYFRDALPQDESNATSTAYDAYDYMNLLSHKSSP